MIYGSSVGAAVCPKHVRVASAQGNREFLTPFNSLPASPMVSGQGRRRTRPVDGTCQCGVRVIADTVRFASHERR